MTLEERVIRRLLSVGSLTRTGTVTDGLNMVIELFRIPTSLLSMVQAKTFEQFMEEIIISLMTFFPGVVYSEFLGFHIALQLLN